MASVLDCMYVTLTPCWVKVASAAARFPGLSVSRNRSMVLSEPHAGGSSVRLQSTIQRVCEAACAQAREEVDEVAHQTTVRSSSVLSDRHK
eukprot:scaffold2900_cov30-Tisochrysis_lutea.AAC.4